MSEAVNFQRMRRELIEIYKKFLENPKDEILNKKIIAYELKYGGLSVYNDYLKSQPVPKDIETALGGLSTIYQYGLWEMNTKLFQMKRLLKKPKKFLKN